jgi:hypothetical protein
VQHSAMPWWFMGRDHMAVDVRTLKLCMFLAPARCAPWVAFLFALLSGGPPRVAPTKRESSRATDAVSDSRMPAFSRLDFWSAVKRTGRCDLRVRH